VGKGKLEKFRENAQFEHVFEPRIPEHLAIDHPLKGNWNRQFFKNTNPLILELGCGKGEYSVNLARHYNTKNFVGIDIKGARIWKGAKTSFEEGLKNVAFLRTRIEIITSFFGKNEVDEIWITFPDPQQKKQRSKKRLTSALFLSKYQQLLKDGGIVHLKTDSSFLYKYTCNLVTWNKLEILKSTPDLYSESWTDEILSIQTHYEKLHIDDGDRINYLAFRLPMNQEIKELPD